MALARVRVDTTTQEKLGDDGLEEVCRCLWAVDCQTCGHPLDKDDPPALWINAVGDPIAASLHHARCRSPEWRENGPLVLVGAGLSWAAHMVPVPLVTGDQQAHQVAMLLLNPGLEQVVVERDSQGRWRVTPPEVFRDAGLVPMGSQLKIDPNPIEGAIARFTPRSIAVTIRSPFPETYEAPADGRILDQARALGGVLLGVTHAINPEELTEEMRFRDIISEQLLIGWVRRDEASV
jgi:hypothetical protein